MEGLDSQLDKLANAFIGLSHEPGTGFKAKLAHVVNPHDFYVIPIKFLYNHYPLTRAAEPLVSSAMEKGTVVIYESHKPEVNKYFPTEEPSRKIRGVIEHIEKDLKCWMFALDYGFMEANVTLDQMYFPFNAEGESVPPIALHCTLSKCFPKKDGIFTPQAIHAFKQFVGTERVHLTIRRNICEVFDVSVYSSGPYEVSQKLANNNLTSTVDPQLNAYKFIQRDVSVGQTLTVRVQFGSSLNSFYVAPMAAFEEYLRKRGDLQIYCYSNFKISMDDFVPGKAVAVKVSSLSPYERAIIVDVLPDEMAKVQLVDWGTEFVTDRAKIRAIKYSPTLISSPVCALYCTADPQFQPWDTGNSNFLTEGYTFNITIKNLGKGFETPHTVTIERCE